MDFINLKAENFISYLQTINTKVKANTQQGSVRWCIDKSQPGQYKIMELLPSDSIHDHYRKVTYQEIFCIANSFFSQKCFTKSEMEICYEALTYMTDRKIKKSSSYSFSHLIQSLFDRISNYGSRKEFIPTVALAEDFIKKLKKQIDSLPNEPLAIASDIAVNDSVDDRTQKLDDKQIVSVVPPGPNHQINNKVDNSPLVVPQTNKSNPSGLPHLEEYQPIKNLANRPRNSSNLSRTTSTPALKPSPNEDRESKPNINLTPSRAGLLKRMQQYNSSCQSLPIQNSNKMALPVQKLIEKSYLETYASDPYHCDPKVKLGVLKEIVIYNPAHARCQQQFDHAPLAEKAAYSRALGRTPELNPKFLEILKFLSGTELLDMTNLKSQSLVLDAISLSTPNEQNIIIKWLIASDVFSYHLFIECLKRALHRELSLSESLLEPGSINIEEKLGGISFYGIRLLFEFYKDKIYKTGEDKKHSSINNPFLIRTISLALAEPSMNKDNNLDKFIRWVTSLKKLNLESFTCLIRPFIKKKEETDLQHVRKALLIQKYQSHSKWKKEIRNNEHYKDIQIFLNNF